MMMQIEDYYGKYVTIELSTGESHQGLLEEIDDEELFGYVKISNGMEVYMIPAAEVVKISQAQAH
jgi:hypothetical protein